MNITLKELKEKLIHHGDTRILSAWQKGVISYACEMIENIQSDSIMNKEEIAERHPVSDFLNHVELRNVAIYGNWDFETWKRVNKICSDVSYGGKFEIYDGEVVKRLCPPWVQKAYNNGKFQNGFKNRAWLDRQAKAIFQAIKLIRHYIKIDRNQFPVPFNFEIGG